MALFLVLLFFVCIANAVTTRVVARDYRPGQATETHTCNHVRPIPDEMFSAEQNRPGLNRTFYKKYTEAYGIPVFGSENVTDDALQRACYVVRFVFAGHSGIRATFYKLGGRFAIMSETEVTLDVPEHSGMNPYWNWRARGLGGGLGSPVTTGAEENLLCRRHDRYRAEDIFLHEMAHGVDLVAARVAIPEFPANKSQAFNAARVQGLWNNTYANTNNLEYLAEGVQTYFDVNAESRAGGNGIHNNINTREELMNYDRRLYHLIKQLFPCNNTYLKRCHTTREQEHNQVLQMNCNTENIGLPAFMANHHCNDRDAIGCVGKFLRGECQRSRQTQSYCRGTCNRCVTLSISKG